MSEKLSDIQSQCREYVADLKGYTARGKESYSNLAEVIEVYNQIQLEELKLVSLLEIIDRNLPRTGLSKEEKNELKIERKDAISKFNRIKKVIEALRTKALTTVRNSYRGATQSNGVGGKGNPSGSKSNVNPRWRS